MRRVTVRWIVGGVALSIALMGSLAAQKEIPVAATILDGDCPGGYQVSVADVDGDGRPDVLTLGRTVRWLKNGSWSPHPITGSQTQANIDLAPRDIDGDGVVDLAVASDFKLEEPTRGKLQWLRRTNDVHRDWQLFPIADVPSIHRIRWADVDGEGRKVLVAAPLLGRAAGRPSREGVGARLSFFRVPPDPARDRWTESLIDNQLHVIHGLLVYDFDGDGRDDLLTASFEGVHLFQPRGSGKNLSWVKKRLAAGAQDPNRPAAGASEVQVGRLVNGGRYLATIEPWHGDTVVVYTKPEHDGDLWVRHVIATGLEAGHALAVLDVDGDGSEEIVAGYRGNKGGVVLFRAADHSGTRWDRYVIDDGTLACQGFFVADLLGTKRPAVVGIGGATHNVKLFQFDGK